MKIPITKTFFGSEELLAVQKPLEAGWVVQGPYVQQFEELFSAYSGSTSSIATSNCTTALHISVAALGLKPGDEVIVPALTWVSTANVVEYMGAIPIFCDIDLQTFNINVLQIESLITPRTVGIIPVHLFGLCADMIPLLELAKKHHLWVVEDAACGFGAWYHGRHAGTFGDAGCFSFHPRKSITTGEGGMITTSRADLTTLSRSLRDHGASRTDHVRHHNKAAFLLAEYNHLGYNYRMTDIQGALGCVQLRRATEIMSARVHWAKRYDEKLKHISWLQTPIVPSECVHGYQSYVCLFQPQTPSMANLQRLSDQRNQLMLILEEQGVSTRQGTHAPVNTGYYANKYDISPENYPYASIAEGLSLTLPLYPQMTEIEQDYVLEHLVKGFECVV